LPNGGLLASSICREKEDEDSVGCNPFPYMRREERGERGFEFLCFGAAIPDPRQQAPGFTLKARSICSKL